MRQDTVSRAVKQAGTVRSRFQWSLGELVLYFVLAFAISWMVVVPALSMASEDSATLFIVLGAFGPFLAAIIVIWANRGPIELRRWLRQIFTLRIPVVLYVSGAFFIPGERQASERAPMPTSRPPSGMRWEACARKRRVVLLMLSLACLCPIAACQREAALRPISTARAGVAYGVHIDEGYAYITNNEGVIVFDVRDPGRPREAGRIETGYSTSVFVNDGWAFISGERGLVIADVSNPASPREVAEHHTEGTATRMRLDGSFAYIATIEGLEIVDVTDPRAPTEVAYLSVGEAWGIDIYDGMAYLAVPEQGLEVIDVRDPFHPRRIGKVSETRSAWDVHIHQRVAYVGCHGAGIRILSLAERESPQLIGRYLDDDGGEALGVWGDGDLLYVADNVGIEVLDVSDPTHPYEIGEYGKVNGAHDLTVEGEFVFVAEGRRGLIILEYGQHQVP